MPAASHRAPDPDAVNVLRPSRPRSRVNGRAQSVDAARQAEAMPERGSADRPPVAATASSGSGASTDPWALPQSVRERFVQERRRFYFPDGTEAFRDRGRRLTTGSENTEVVRSLVEIAQTRGWGEIVVEGTERFRREAWRQARLADLEVRGYRPTETERAVLARALARKAEGAQLELNVSDRADEGRAHGAGESRAPSAPAEAHADRSSGQARNALWVGTLLDHGREHYRFDPQEDLSYFVRIRNAEGTRTIWGKDLERAITHSLTQPAIGDAVGLRRVGAETVTVRRRERDADGQVIGENAHGAERHRWVIENRGFFEERAEAAALVRDGSVNRKEVAGAHPELVGTFLQLRAAELAARRLRDPQDQKRFVALVRGALADAVERGEPLQPVRLRNRPAPAPQRAPRAQEAQRVR
jgi:putative DNA primase/helicase